MIHELRAHGFRWTRFGLELLDQIDRDHFGSNGDPRSRWAKVDGMWVRRVAGGTATGFTRVGGGFALDIVTGRAAGPGARTTYLALLTAAPSDSNTIAALTETTMTGYARQSMAFAAPTVATPPSTQNSGVLTFGPVTGSMATVSDASLVSPSSGTVGDHLAMWHLTTARTPTSGDSLQAAAGAFTMTDE
jgi:hypothetical protein